MWTYTAEEFDWLTGPELPSFTGTAREQAARSGANRHQAPAQAAKSLGSAEVTAREIEDGIARGKRLRARVIAKIAKRTSAEVRRRAARAGLARQKLTD